jgi:hypothetical protein
MKNIWGSHQFSALEATRLGSSAVAVLKIYVLGIESIDRANEKCVGKHARAVINTILQIAIYTSRSNTYC